MTDLQESAALFQRGVTETTGISLMQALQSALAHVARQKGGTGTPQAVAGNDLGEHPAGFAEALEAGGPASHLVGKNLHFLVHSVGAPAHRLPGFDGLIGDFPALPGGFLNGPDAAFHHRQPGLETAVILLLFGKIIERLPVGFCRGGRTLC